MLKTSRGQAFAHIKLYSCIMTPLADNIIVITILYGVCILIIILNEQCWCCDE